MQIKRGEIYTINLGKENKIGSEQKGYKICVIVQNDVGNFHSPTTKVSIITSKLDKHSLPTHVLIPDGVGLHEPSIVIVEQTFTIDKRRLIKLLGEMDMSGVDKALKISFGLQ